MSMEKKNLRAMIGDDAKGYAHGLDLGRLVKVARKMRSDFALCGFAGKSEAEWLVIQTMCAAKTWLKKAGVPCSIREDSVFSCEGNGLCDNATGYHMCLNRRWFAEFKSSTGATLIFPTMRLVEDLEDYLKMGQSEWEALGRY
jgi:hypothetical protein